MRWILGLAGLACMVLAQGTRELRIESAGPPNPMKDRGTRWALVIGISAYEYLPPAAQLHYSHRDAEDFAGFLRSYAGGALPELTDALQHPRAAGTFDGQVALALTPNSAPPGSRTVSMDVSGPISSALYIDNVFRGKIRATGTLRIDGMTPGPHAFSADFTDGSALQGTVTVSNVPAIVKIAPPPPARCRNSGRG